MSISVSVQYPQTAAFQGRSNSSRSYKGGFRDISIQTAKTDGTSLLRTTVKEPSFKVQIIGLTGTFWWGPKAPSILMCTISAFPREGRALGTSISQPPWTRTTRLPSGVMDQQPPLLQRSPGLQPLLVAHNFSKSTPSKDILWVPQSSNWPYLFWLFVQGRHLKSVFSKQRRSAVLLKKNKYKNLKKHWKNFVLFCFFKSFWQTTSPVEPEQRGPVLQWALSICRQYIKNGSPCDINIVVDGSSCHWNTAISRMEAQKPFSH